MNRLALGLSVLLLTRAQTSLASLTPVLPFSGQFSESWESFPITGPSETFLPNPSLIMAGAASISHPRMATYEQGHTQSLGTSGYSVPSDGTQLMGIDGSEPISVTITFTEPIEIFGAFWGAATSISLGNPASITVQFFNESESLVGTEVLSYSRPGDGVLEWHGWSSDIPIKTITYTEDFVVIDGLQANPIPEPTTAALASLAGAMILTHRRHRRARPC